MGKYENITKIKQSVEGYFDADSPETFIGTHEQYDSAQITYLLCCLIEEISDIYNIFEDSFRSRYNG